jgi:SPP1 gp7 family putative phage head morphogenesis protein
MRYDLAELAKRSGVKRSKPIRDIIVPATFTADLYRVTYRRVVNYWQAQAPRINAAYATSLSELTNDSADDIAAMLEQTDSELSRLFILIAPELRSFAVRIERWHKIKWVASVLSATGIDINTLIGTAREPLANFIARNTDLIKDVSTETRRKISAAVYNGLSNNTPAREVAKQIRAATDFTRARSLRIASDQVSKIAATLADERAIEAGFTEYLWRHSGKVNFRPEHLARDGQRFKYGEPAGDTPGQAIRCACRSQAYPDLD